jgi:hypothetical protein
VEENWPEGIERICLTCCFRLPVECALNTRAAECSTKQRATHCGELENLNNSIKAKGVDANLKHANAITTGGMR